MNDTTSPDEKEIRRSRQALRTVAKTRQKLDDSVRTGLDDQVRVIPCQQFPHTLEDRHLVPLNVDLDQLDRREFEGIKGAGENRLPLPSPVDSRPVVIGSPSLRRDLHVHHLRRVGGREVEERHVVERRQADISRKKGKRSRNRLKR